MPTDRVIEVLEVLFSEHGAPECLRSDNGPDMIATKLVEWLSRRGVQLHHINPGVPWQNAYGESFNAILRRGCLNRELFYGVLEARVKTEARAATVQQLATSQLAGVPNTCPIP